MKYPGKEFRDRRPVSIDFYNNYMTNFHDNPFEADGGMHNIRIMRNMMINSASHAFCNQPELGGPVYWYRNIAYHLPGGSTRLTSGSAGVLFYNNTIFSETTAQATSNVHWRNNLFLGENSQEAIFSVNTFTGYTSSDYNGFRPNAGVKASFQWSGPSTASGADYSGAGAERAAASVAPVRIACRIQRGDQAGHPQHPGRLRPVRERPAPRCAGSFQGPEGLQGGGFRLPAQAGAAAIDKGTALPGVTDGFAGTAPDLGAIEAGAALPHYGPRN